MCYAHSKNQIVEYILFNVGCEFVISPNPKKVSIIYAIVYVKQKKL